MQYIYTGKKRNFTFEKYGQMHKDVPIMMDELTDAQYDGLDAQSKLNHLVDGIKNSALDTVKATIWASAMLGTDFGGTIYLFKKFITQQNTGSSVTNNLREASTPQHSGGGHGGQGIQVCSHGVSGVHICRSFGGCGCGGGRRYQVRGCRGGGWGNSPLRINDIDISYQYYTPN